MKNLTAYSLSRMEDRLQLGEISYLPTIFPVKREELEPLGEEILKLLDGNEAFRNTLPEDLQRYIRAGSYSALMFLSQHYSMVRGMDKEPEHFWVELLPVACRRYMRIEYWRGEGSDPLCIVGNLFSHNFAYVIEDSGFLENVCRALDVWRLQDIRQLAFLRDPVAKAELVSVSLPFQHSRLIHTYDVVALLQLLIAKNPVLEKDGLNLLAAGMGHDAMTPAGGDATKSVDHDRFCEEKNFHKLLTSKKWKLVVKQFGLDSAKIEQTVLGHGLLGKVLDIADKCAYMARDADELIRKRELRGSWYLEEGFVEIERVFQEHPDVCALWQYASIEGGQLVIEDLDALERFLRLRALLFRWFYYNPKSRVLEQVIAQRVIKFLYKTGKVTYEELMTRGDVWLESRMEELTGLWISFIHLYQGCGVRSFATFEEAKQFETSASVGDKYLTFVEEFLPRTSDGTHKFFVRNGKGVVTFAEARPKEAGEISNILHCRHDEKVWYYAVPMDELHIRDDVWKELREFS